MKKVFLKFVFETKYLFFVFLFSSLLLVGSSLLFPDTNSNIALRTSEIIKKTNGDDKYKRVYYECNILKNKISEIPSSEKVFNLRNYQEGLFLNVANDSVTINGDDFLYSISSFTYKNENDYYFLEDLKFYNNLSPKKEIFHGAVVSSNFVENFLTGIQEQNIIGHSFTLGGEEYNICGVYSYKHSYRCSNYDFNANFGDVIFIQDKDFFEKYSQFKVFFSMSFNYETNKTAAAVCNRFSKGFSIPEIESNNNFYNDQSLYDYFDVFLSSPYFLVTRIIGGVLFVGGLVSLLKMIFYGKKEEYADIKTISFMSNKHLVVAKITVSILFELVLFFLINAIAKVIIINGFHFIFIGYTSTWLFIASVFLTIFIGVVRYLDNSNKVIYLLEAEKSRSSFFEIKI